MPLRFYNTLTRSKELFEPITPGKVSMYTCGPTVYSFAHIGNLRTFLFPDLLRRHLTYRGYDVTYVMNITDVEDKIIRTCRETGESLASLTERYTKEFLTDLDTLGIEQPQILPRATHHIDDMVDLIKKLQANGHTYEVDGSIYYRITSFDDYGKLSNFDLEALESGASGRVDNDEYSTEDARDFALWKAYVPEDGEVFWETELGKGRPGWHLECSCMSMKYLGENFDIHCGAVDLIFPHHENEIAQSQAATGKPFVNYWLHAAHLNLEGRKISKSLGNVVTLRTLLDEGHDPLAIRYALRATHYRQPTNFSTESLDSAKQALQRIHDFRHRLERVVSPQGEDLTSLAEKSETKFAEALDDDLNISAALGAAFEFIKEVNRLLDDENVSQEGSAKALALLNTFDDITGLFEDNAPTTISDEINELVGERQKARREKDFARADSIRDQLHAQGWVVEDTSDGPILKPV